MFKCSFDTGTHTHTPTDSKAYLTHLSRRLWSTVMQPRGEQATLSLLVEHWRGAAWNKTQFPFVSWWKFCAHAAACEVAKWNSNVCLCERVHLMRGPGHPFQRDPKNVVLYLCPMTVRCTWTKVDEVDNRGNLLLSRWQICVQAFPNTGAASDPDASLGGGCYGHIQLGGDPEAYLEQAGGTTNPILPGNTFEIPREELGDMAEKTLDYFASFRALWTKCCMPNGN